MQSRKASNSKKVNKNTNEASVNEKSAAGAQLTAKPRASRSSKSKKEVSSEAPIAKSRRKSAIGASDIPTSESSLVANALREIEVTDAPKTMSAAAGAEFVPSESTMIDPVGVIAAPENGTGPQHSREDVAKLAYSYWIVRGYSHGMADEDWLRAEAELAGKR